MAFEPKDVDTRGEPRAFAFGAIAASDDGRWARIVFLERDLKTEIPIQLAADLLEKMLPTLRSVAAECERRRSGENKKNVYRIKEGSIHKTSEDGIVFDFVIPTGERMAFEMDKTGAILLFSALEKVLQMAEHQSGTVDPPRRH
jgi:hypothetical protein